MTWVSAKEAEAMKRPPPAYTATAPNMVPVTSQYTHHPKKSVLAVSGIIVAAGILLLLLGIARECLARDWKMWGIWCGIFFLITGILGIVSAHKPTKRHLIIVTVLAIITTMTACYMSYTLSHWYWSEARDGLRQRIDWGGVLPKGKSEMRRIKRADEFSITMLSANAAGGLELRRGKRGHKGKDDDKRKAAWKKISGGTVDWGRSMRREYEKHKNERRYYKKAAGLNATMFVLQILVFACSIALAVFALKTVTSPRMGGHQGIYPVLTPVVSFPPSKDPNQLDSFNGNDDYI